MLFYKYKRKSWNSRFSTSTVTFIVAALALTHSPPLVDGQEQKLLCGGGDNTNNNNNNSVIYVPPIFATFKH